MITVLCRTGLRRWDTKCHWVLRGRNRSFYTGHLFELDIKLPSRCLPGNKWVIASQGGSKSKGRQGTVSYLMCLRAEWHGDRRWYEWLNGGWTLKGRVCLARELELCLYRNGFKQADALVLGKKPWRSWGCNGKRGVRPWGKLWKFFSKYLLNSHVCQVMF